MITNKVKEVNYGIAFTSGNGNIYINKDLKKYDKDLYDKVLKHEKSHDLGAYNTNDLKEDMEIDFFPFKERIKFCMKYPRGFAFLSPILVTDEEIMISAFGIFKWLVVLGIISFILFIVGSVF